MKLEELFFSYLVGGRALSFAAGGKEEEQKRQPWQRLFLSESDLFFF